MKSMANGIILKSNTVTPLECLHYALNLPTATVICGIDKQEVLDQAFKVAEEKSAVFDNAAAKRSAELVLVNGRERRAGSVAEKVVGIERGVLEVFEAAAVEGVRAGLADDADDAAGGAAVFGGG